MSDAECDRGNKERAKVCRMAVLLFTVPSVTSPKCDMTRAGHKTGMNLGSRTISQRVLVSSHVSILYTMS